MTAETESLDPISSHADNFVSRQREDLQSKAFLAERKTSGACFQLSAQNI